VKVYSNCEEVELFVNGKSVGKHRSDKDQYATNLKHPPFTFHLSKFIAGTLTAAGYINNKKVVGQSWQTPGEPVQIILRVDESGRKLQAGQNDMVFVYAHITDQDGTVIPGTRGLIDFEVIGDTEIVGLHSVPAEAGTATILLKAGAKPGSIKIPAKAKGLKGVELMMKSE
jgi:beta-galactosidase